MDWLKEVLAVVAPDIEVPDDIRDELLDLARIASHTSGERTNAPLLCYALGLAVGRGASLESLSAAVREKAGNA